MIWARSIITRNQQTHDLTLRPLGLVQRSQVTYLIASAESFEDIRQFVLHRIQTAAPIDRPANRPPDFDLQRYIESGTLQFGSGQSIRLKAWITEGLARLMRETPLSQDMEISQLPDGATLTATVADSWELRWWILSHAGSIRIDKLHSLKEAIVQRRQQALELQSP